MMFKTLAVGYGSAAILAIAGAAIWGGGTLWWVAFAWLVGAPITILCAGLMSVLHLAPLPERPLGRTAAHQRIPARH
jgi:hypothetical protein